jgi:hypothetical protein
MYPPTNDTSDSCAARYARLGARFWLPWSLAMLALIGGTAAFFVFARSALGMPLRAIAATAWMILFTIGLVVLSNLPRRALTKRGLEDPMRPAARRYMQRFLPPMLLYAVLFVAAGIYAEHNHPTGLAAIAVALAPALPVLAAIRVMFLFLKEEKDEYLHTRMLESWTLATGLTLAICMVWGMLDQFQVVPHMALWAVFPLWSLCLCPAEFLVKRRGG